MVHAVSTIYEYFSSFRNEWPNYGRTTIAHSFL